jgi:hypothetical protein
MALPLLEFGNSADAKMPDSQDNNGEVGTTEKKLDYNGDISAEDDCILILKAHPCL